MRLLLAALAAAAAVAVAGGAPTAQALPPGFQETVVFSGLVNPTVIRFASDGRVFVGEKSGLIKVFDNLSDTTPTVFADLRTNTHNFWDRGLLGLALAPTFPTDPSVYVLYTYDAAIGGTAPRWGTVGGTADGCPTPPGATADGCVVSGRLSRLQAAGNVQTGPEQVLLEDWCQQYPSHSVGALDFGADGALYVSGGDGASFNFTDWGQDGSPTNPCGDPPGGNNLTPPTAEGGALRSQDVRTTSDPAGLNGAVLRLNPATGAGLPDNPLAFSSDPNARRIIAYGFRNPFRIAVRPGTNEVWTGDVGWNDWEEIDLVQNQADGAADNYGWPCYEGNGRNASYDNANLNLCETLYAQTGATVTPYFTYSHSATVAPTGDTCPTGSSSISGFAFESGSNFPSLYDGATFFADYSRNCIWVMRAGADGKPDPSTRQMFAPGAAGPVDLEFGPDGALYYAAFDAGTIRRISATGSDPTPPTVSLTAPASGATVTGTTTVSATASDNSGTVAGVQFRLDGADLGAEDTSAPFQLSWDSQTTTNGSHTLTAVARDPTGNTATSAPVTITVSNSGNPPPVGLVAALGFDEGSGTTTADTSGAGNNGSISGAAWNTTGRYGSALSYDGTNDWVTIAGSASLDLSGGMTLEAWVRPAALGGWRTVLLREQTGFYTYALYADTGTGQPSGNAVVAGNDIDVRAPTPVPLNAWSHLATTYDGASVTLYVNGAQVGQQAATGPIAAGTGPLRIGGNAIWPEWFQGLIDEVRVYNRALTPAEIQSDMTRPITNADGQPPGPPGTLTATGSLGAVSLAWGAASDNTGVVRYNVHRGTSAGFTPALANRIAQPTTTSYVDTGLAAGTYYYRVTAEDAAGNVGAPSNEASAAALADTQPPTASVTAPAGGATVSGTVQVTATATDNGTVAGVQFRLDGGTLGAEDTTSPYAVDWPTATATDGSHTLTAVARDGAGNTTTSTPVTVTVNNTAPTGLVAAYAFDEGAGTTAADSSGSGNTGSLSGATWATAGRYGGAISFDGVNDWVTVTDANSLDLTSAMTLEAWVNPSALGTAWRTVVFKEQVGNLTYGLYANRNTTRPNAQVYVAGADRNVDGSAALPLNAWTHLAATYDGAMLRLYVGGVQVAQFAQTGAIATSTGALRIGGNNIWSEWFAGRIDDVRVYNRALTPTQIQTDMNTPVGGAQNTPPQVTITAPASGTTWKVDDVITFAASATDAQDGTLPPAAFDWVVLIQHCPSNCHSHTYQSFDDVAGGSFPAPDHEYPSHLELRVTATDANGATATASLPLQPQTVDLTFATSPPGLQLTVGPTTGTAPFTRTVIVGSTNSVSAPTPQTLGGTSYAFSSWSDDGAQTHTIVAPATQATITATYQSDPNAPTVSITSPGAGATVSGSVGVAATADDDVGVVGVRFTLDGAALGSEDTTAPYQVTWDTTAAANGPHTLRAIARDGAGNETTSAPVAVTVANNHAPTAVATGTPLTGPAPLTVAFDGSGSSDPDAGDSLSYAWDLDGDGQFDDSTAVAPSVPYTVPGTVSVRLRVTDGGGLTATSPPLTVTVTPARPSPVAAYGFEETTGSTVTDKSGNGNSGVISGATRITTGHTGRALSFDGVNDWVTVADAASLDLTAGMTLEAWVYPTSLGNANRAVIVKEGSTASVYALSAHRSANPRRPTGSADVAGQRVVVGASQLSTNTWFHLAVTYDGTTLRLYVDGTLSASLPVTGSIATSTGALRLGGTALGTQWFRGRLDDVRVYASALTQAQVQEDMAAAVPA